MPLMNWKALSNFKSSFIIPSPLASVSIVSDSVNDSSLFIIPTLPELDCVLSAFSARQKVVIIAVGNWYRTFFSVCAVGNDCVFKIHVCCRNIFCLLNEPDVASIVFYLWNIYTKVLLWMAHKILCQYLNLFLLIMTHSCRNSSQPHFCKSTSSR